MQDLLVEAAFYAPELPRFPGSYSLARFRVPVRFKYDQASIWGLPITTRHLGMLLLCLKDSSFSFTWLKYELSCKAQFRRYILREACDPAGGYVALWPAPVAPGTSPSIVFVSLCPIDKPRVDLPAGFVNLLEEINRLPLTYIPSIRNNL